MTLERFFKENNKIALGFSGGVDSSYLLWAAKKYNADIMAYYVRTRFQPKFEYRDAIRLANDLNAKITVIDHDILAHSAITANPCNRCYYCKTEIFSAICEKALQDGYRVIIDGTNASDDAEDRPGMKALKELKVISPLRECGITKSDIRRLSKEAGLFTWDKPAYACLATRINTGSKITAEKLEKIEKSEGFLFDMGFVDFRVRMYYDIAKLQFTEKDIKRAFEMRDIILAGLSPYFEDIVLDMKDRRTNG